MLNAQLRWAQGISSLHLTPLFSSPAPALALDSPCPLLSTLPFKSSNPMLGAFSPAPQGGLGPPPRPVLGFPGPQAHRDSESTSLPFLPLPAVSEPASAGPAWGHHRGTSCLSPLGRSHSLRSWCPQPVRGWQLQPAPRLPNSRRVLAGTLVPSERPPRVTGAKGRAETSPTPRPLLPVLPRGWGFWEQGGGLLSSGGGLRVGGAEGRKACGVAVL